MEMYDEESQVHLGMLNSYDIAVYKVPYSELAITENSFFIHDITKPITRDVIDDLMYYFEVIEDYEKCAQLQKIRHEYDTI
tara:strand:- start:191 stop:433 length:243 start_codon:yes stop_codon:yes gene_type:complete